VRLGLYLGWDGFVKEALYWSQASGPNVGLAYRNIFRWLHEQEVSVAGVGAWSEKSALT
jgi:hypothetical protein